MGHGYGELLVKLELLLQFRVHLLLDLVEVRGSLLSLEIEGLLGAILVAPNELRLGLIEAFALLLLNLLQTGLVLGHWVALRDLGLSG